MNPSLPLVHVFGEAEPPHATSSWSETRIFPKNPEPSLHPSEIMTTPVLLTIAGTDPSGGAGLQVSARLNHS
jgi:hypothetical protein